MSYTVHRYGLVFNGVSHVVIQKGAMVIGFSIDDYMPFLVFAINYSEGELEEREFLVYPENFNIDYDFFIPIGVAKDNAGGFHWCVEIIKEEGK